MDSKQSYRSVVFISLLCGTVIWICYRAHLTAELSVTQKDYPFTDLETLSRTSWRFVYTLYTIFECRAFMSCLECVNSVVVDADGDDTTYKKCAHKKTFLF